MIKVGELGRVLRFQAAMGLTGVHYHAHGSEPSDPKAQAEFHARRLGLSKDDPAAAKAGTNYQVHTALGRSMSEVAAGNSRDVILTHEFWTTPPKPQPTPEI